MILLGISVYLKFTLSLPDGHRSAVVERGLLAEIRNASSSDADHVNPAGSTQAGLFYDYESP